ncbi:hypothetical protein KCU83_g105, partial [Aureobasidium melanogenum]
LALVLLLFLLGSAMSSHTTGFAVAAFVALILNLILPEEIEDEEIPELTANTIDAPADEEEWRHIRREDESEKISPAKN